MRNATWFSMFCAAGLTCGLVACGDDTTSGTTATTGTTTATTTTTTSSGTGGGGGAGGASNLLNGCDADGADAVDRTGDMAVTIVNVGSTSYDPRCVRVAAGTDITMDMNFAIHPLVGGSIVDGALIPDPASDIPNTTTGDTVTFTLDAAGVFPYYCNVHAPGMAGVIFVE